MRVFDSTFMANEAGVEGPAVMSIGYLEQLSNVTFSENAYFCRAGEYGYSYIVENEARNPYVLDTRMLLQRNSNRCPTYGPSSVEGDSSWPKYCIAYCLEIDVAAEHGQKLRLCGIKVSRQAD